MSVVCTFSKGWVISHEGLINSLYSNIETAEGLKSYRIARDLFKIISPFKKSGAKSNLKRKYADEENIAQRFKQLKQIVSYVEHIHTKFQDEVRCSLQPDGVDTRAKNDCPLKLSKKVYDESGNAPVVDVVGGNNNGAAVVTINGSNYLFPENCRFYCKDVMKMQQYLINIKFDIIVLDPPWWNKYVRRKKAKTNHGYHMMYNEDIKKIPVENLLNDDGLVVVWCTNSIQHLETLQQVIFPKWNVHSVARWYWLKVTQTGEPICSFSEPPGKQPFEQIVFGCRNLRKIPIPEDGKVVISIPSALHSHKPPLVELLRQYLPENPRCLELFARYLLPNWTSWGLEAIRFQHESLYELTLKTKK